MFKTEEKTDLNQISLTGLRALVFISLLVSKPCSMDEIKQNLINLKIMDENQKDDILRIDLNTIKSMGCEILRCSQKTGYKYVLQKRTSVATFIKPPSPYLNTFVNVTVGINFVSMKS